MKAIFLLFVIFCVSSGTAEKRIFKEKNSRPSAQWIVGERVEKDVPLKLIFALAQQNPSKLEQIFWDVSNPDSPNYGKYLSTSEVQALVKPSPETFSTVLGWIHQFKVLEIDERNDFLVVTVTAETAETMLHCVFHKFSHVHDPHKSIIRSNTPYSLPEDVAAHVDFVGGVSHFPRIKKRSLNTPKIDFQVTPRLLKERYFIGDAVGKNTKNSQSVAQFLDQYYSNIDLQEFFTLLLQSAIGNTAKTVGPNDLGAGVEASLDIEYIMSTGQNVPTVFWSTGGLYNNQEPFLQWMMDIDNSTNFPLLFSVSYGDDEDSLSKDYTTRVNKEFQKQGIKGISILFASGDDGVGNGGDCTTFVPDYPASSPFVTTVGGTTLEGWLETGDEIVNDLSGGGFSNYFTQPPYQLAAVSNYIQNSKLPKPDLWNRTGRAYPDLAALSDNYLVVCNLIPMPGVAGTSCATPATSGIIALLNDLRLEAGKPSLGFLNPLLYKLGSTAPQVFTDIIKGSNPGCNTDGFPAAKGWDPASGWGSLNYAEFAKIVVNL